MRIIAKEFVGKRFGRLTGVGTCFGNNHKTMVVCLCACGKSSTVSPQALRTKATRSCGCLAKETSAKQGKKNRTHGRSTTATYSVWRNMLTRCDNPRAFAFHRYGGRGITVCERWRSFANFRLDMGDPKKGATIDRIDNDGNYEPGNCRWASRVQQANNRIKNRFIVAFGQTKTLAEWSRDRKCRAGYVAILKRIGRGWKPEDAITRPLRKIASLVSVLVLAAVSTHTTNAQCDSLDFNRDGIWPDTQDIDDFRSVFSGGPCGGQQPGDPPCNTDIDFDNNGLFPDTADIDAFVRVFSGGPCVVADDGWTQLPGLPAGARVVYVEDGGSDANDGLDRSRPKRTFNVAWTQVRSGVGDRICIADDLTMNGVNGGSMYHKSDFVVYGDTLDGHRPIVTRVGPDAAFYLGGSTAFRVSILNLDVRGRGAAYGLQSYVTGGEWLFEGCSFTGFSTGVNLNGTLNIVTFRRCVFADNQSQVSHSQGVYIEGVHDILFDQCVWDHNGRGYSGDAGTMYNHNLYANATCSGVVVRDSISARASATGLQMRWNRQDAIGNLLIDCPLGITLGHDSKGSTWPSENVTGSIMGNWIQGTADIATNMPRGGPAIGFGYANNVTISGNWVVNGPNSREAAIRTDRPSKNVTVIGNTIIRWAGGEYAEASTAIPRDPSNVIDTTPAFAPRTSAPTVADYVAHFKIQPATTEKFLELARANRKGAWDDRWTARAFIEWARTK